MGSLFGGGSQKSTTVNKTELPKWVEDAGKNNYAMAQSVAGQPYTPYTEARVAPLSGNENTAIGLAAGNTGVGDSYLADTRNYLNSANRSLTDMDMSAYMNPYISNALAPAAREITQAGQGAINDANARAVSSGAFGTSRGRLNQGEIQEKTMQQLGDLYSQGYASAFDSAVNSATDERNRALTSASTSNATGALSSDLIDSAITRLGSTGGTERGVTQQSLDTAYGDFQNQQNYSTEQLNKLIAALSGTPYETSTTGTSSGGSQNTGQGIGQLAGLGMQAYSMFSDKNAKEGRRSSEDPEETLSKIASLDVDRWRYKPAVRDALGDHGNEHIGPMAQDFAARFGGDGHKIDVVDGFGVVLNALKGLERRTRNTAA